MKNHIYKNKKNSLYYINCEDDENGDISFEETNDINNARKFDKNTILFYDGGYDKILYETELVKLRKQKLLKLRNV